MDEHDIEKLEHIIESLQRDLARSNRQVTISPQYQAWRNALDEIAREHGVAPPAKIINSRAETERLVKAGADPAAIIAVAALCFPELI